MTRSARIHLQANGANAARTIRSFGNGMTLRWQIGENRKRFRNLWRKV